MISFIYSFIYFIFIIFIYNSHSKLKLKSNLNNFIRQSIIHLAIKILITKIHFFYSILLISTFYKTLKLTLESKNNFLLNI